MTSLQTIYDIFCEHRAVVTDTRQIVPSALFFALRGSNFNGNDFAAQALEAGCAYAVVDDAEVAQRDARMLLVDDVLATLQQLAAYHRRQLRTPILQITGTNGKTTTKELCAAVLSQRYNVLYTQGNLNNHIGVPLTLLRLDASHDVAVIETGANHPGEIRALAQIVDADCGLITNVGRAHLEGFGSFEGVMKTKGELYDYLRTKPQGFIFVDADNEHLMGMAHDLPHITYGRPGQDYDVEGEATDGSAMLKLRFRTRESQWHTVETHLIGAYNATNALAAAAVGSHFGVSASQIAAALEQYRPTNNRSELRRTEANTLIVDAYNANPTSMAAALDNFETTHHPHKMAILGEMRELGQATLEEHCRIIERLPNLGCEQVWLVGQAFAQAETFCALKRARQGQKNPGVATLLFKDAEDVKQHLLAHKPTGCLILIKGSNGTRLFELPQEL